MAHNIATINGRVAMAYDGETPWHKLGTRLPHLTDVATALDTANLNWTVNLEPMFLADGREVPNRKAVVRDVDASVLATVSAAYGPIQNSEAASILADVCADYGVTIESAGALGVGETVWMLARLPQGDMAPVPGDDVRGYFLLKWAHDASSALVGLPTPIRVVCQNTLSLATGAGRRARSNSAVWVSHYQGTTTARVDAARKLVTSMVEALQVTGDTFASLAYRRMSAAEVVTYIETVFPTRKDDKDDISTQLKQRRADVAQLVWSGVGAELAMSATDGEPNAWACYNAVTEYFDHVVLGRAQGATAKAKAAQYAIFGGGDTLKLAALAAARELVAA